MLEKELANDTTDGYFYPTNNLGLNNEVDKNIQYLDVESNTIFTSCSSRENLDRDKIGITQLNMN